MHVCIHINIQPSANYSKIIRIETQLARKKTRKKMDISIKTHCVIMNYKKLRHDRINCNMLNSMFCGPLDRFQRTPRGPWTRLRNTVLDPSGLSKSDIATSTPNAKKVITMAITTNANGRQ